MTPALLIWLYKKHGQKVFNNRARHNLKAILRKAATVICALFFSLLLHGQERKLVYQVIHNGNNIGQMQFLQKISGQDLYLQMNSQVKARFVIPINIQTADKAHFNNGKLVYSDVYRSVNGKEKENKKTRLLNNNYQTQAGSEINQINRLIDYNMMLLYCREPNTISQVYSDNFQQFLSIKKLAQHIYRIHLPNGNYNDYHFRNGICRMVIVHQDWYTITMKLV